MASFHFFSFFFLSGFTSCIFLFSFCRRFHFSDGGIFRRCCRSEDVRYFLGYIVLICHPIHGTRKILAFPIRAETKCRQNMQKWKWNSFFSRIRRWQGFILTVFSLLVAIERWNWVASSMSSDCTKQMRLNQTAFAFRFKPMRCRNSKDYEIISEWKFRDAIIDYKIIMEKQIRE